MLHTVKVELITHCFFGILSPSRLLPLPEGGVQQPRGSPWPQHAALLLPVAPPGRPRLPAGAPHGVAAAGLSRQAAGVQLPHPHRYPAHHIVSFIQSAWLRRIRASAEHRMLLGLVTSEPLLSFYPSDQIS